MPKTTGCPSALPVAAMETKAAGETCTQLTIWSFCVVHSHSERSLVRAYTVDPTTATDSHWRRGRSAAPAPSASAGRSDGRASAWTALSPGETSSGLTTDTPQKGVRIRLLYPNSARTRRRAPQAKNGFPIAPGRAWWICGRKRGLLAAGGAVYCEPIQEQQHCCSFHGYACGIGGRVPAGIRCGRRWAAGVDLWRGRHVTAIKES